MGGSPEKKIDVTIEGSTHAIMILGIFPPNIQLKFKYFLIELFIQYHMHV